MGLRMENTPESKINIRLQELDALIEKADSERQELLIAKKVMSRFNESAKFAAPVIANGKGSARPEGTPTTFEMVEKVLAAAELSGKDGLGISEVVNEIRQAFWPGLTNPQIAPQIYQFALNGRINKTKNGKFKRITNKEASEQKF